MGRTPNFAQNALGPFARKGGVLVPFRHVYRDEWLHAWHYARYGRRHNSTHDHVGPLLREAAREVQRAPRDPLAVRQSMAKTCHPLSAVIATHNEFRAAISKATGSVA